MQTRSRASIARRILLAAVASLLVVGCREAGRSGSPAPGIFSGRAGGVSVEVEIRDDRILHIELLNHDRSSAFEKKAVNAFYIIEWKNSPDAADDDPETADLVEAVRSAVEAAGVSPERLAAAVGSGAAFGPASEYSADLVIIGAGCAGLCAAIEARDQGVGDVIILEKMSFSGGNTRMSNGCYGAPGNWLQDKAGISDDSADRFFDDVYAGAYRTGRKDLIRVLADGALDDALWLRDDIGVRFYDELTWYEGHSRVRVLRTIGDGYRLADTLIEAADKRGVAIHHTTRAVRILRDASGAVTGVEAERGGKKVRYESAHGVVLASGGFGANVQMRQRYDTRWGHLDASVLTSNSPGSTGDGITMAREAGAALVDMDCIQLYPVNNPATGNLYLLDYARLDDNAVLLNRDGRRFVNERATRDVIAATIITQPGSTAFELIDRETALRMRLEDRYAGEIERCVDQGVLKRGSLEECAAFFGLPLGAVRETIRRFNATARGGGDTEFGREGVRPIGDGPYIMFSSVVSVHHTMGGVRIDTEACVLDEGGRRIPGLFAAGEVTGGIHGTNRLGSVALVDGVVFGRIAARSAARYSRN